MNHALKLAAEFNRYFTSSNGVDVPERVSVSRDEWRRLHAAQQAEQPDSPWTENVAVKLKPSRTGRVYIAGPMTGIAEFNFPAFNSEADRLRAEGLTVLNPADHGIVEGAEWADYLRHDIAGLATCQRIHLLQGWEKSKGARLEVTIAQALGMTITLADGSVAPPAQTTQPAEVTDDLVEKATVETFQKTGADLIPEVAATFARAILALRPQASPDGRGTDAQILKEREIARHAIDGAIAAGYAGATHPGADHWLAAAHNAGMRIAELERAMTPVPCNTFLVRDVAELLGCSVPDVCTAFVQLGRGNRSTNMAITPDEALSVARHLALRPAQVPMTEGTARQFVDWMKAQPEDREPTTIDGALAEFEVSIGTPNGAPPHDPWCIHIPGPDEVHAAPSKEAADHMAAKHNAAMATFYSSGAPNLEFAPSIENVQAVAIKWPYDQQSHADELREFDWSGWGLTKKDDK